MDDRLIQRLEEQLRDAHASNGELRERLQAQEEASKRSNAIYQEGQSLIHQYEVAEAKRRAAEKNAAAAERKQKEAGYEVMRLREANERLQEQLERAWAEASELADLNARVESAKHLRDLIS